MTETPSDVWDDKPMPPPDMELRRLAIEAGLVEETDADKAHRMFRALGFKQALLAAEPPKE